MSVYLRGTTYWMSYIDSNGFRKRESCETSNKKIAQQIYEKRKTDILEGKYLTNARGEILFRDFVSEYTKWAKANKRSYKTSDWTYLNSLLPVFADYKLNAITPKLLEDYRITKKETLSTASINRHLALIKAIFNKAIEWDYYHKNPMHKVKLEKENNARTRFLTYEEAFTLLSVCDTKLRNFLLVALNTGMRLSEIMNLKREHIDFNQGTIKISVSKTNSTRFIPMNDTVKAILEKDFDFNYNPKKAFGTAVKKAKIADFKFHDLRHTFASWLALNGIDLNTIRELLGHKEMKMTLRYSHLSQDHKKTAINVLTKNNLVTNQSQFGTLLVVSR